MTRYVFESGWLQVIVPSAEAKREVATVAGSYVHRNIKIVDNSALVPKTHSRHIQLKANPNLRLN